MGIGTRCIRVSVLSVTGAVVGAAGMSLWAAEAVAGAGASPVSLVSFEWGASASGGAGVSMACDQDCAPFTECNNLPVTSFSYGGTEMVDSDFNPQVGRSCGGSCGGAGIASSYFQANGGADVNSPSGASGYTIWSFTNGISAQAGAGVGFGCGTATTGATVQASHFCDMVFDLGPGLTRVTMSYQHFVSGEDPTTTSAWTIGNEQVSFFSQAIDSTNGSNFNIGVVERVLPAGRYRLRLDGSLSESVSAGGMSSQTRSAQVGAAFSLTFETYVCASVVSPPQGVSVCPSGIGQFLVLPGGSSTVSQRWQWQQAGASPDAWTDVVEGTNSDSGGTPRFFAEGADGLVLRVSRDDQPLGGIGVIQAVRCVVSNECGAVASAAAALRVCRGDLNCDGIVDTGDLVVFLGQFGSASPNGSGADINMDGVVNTVDLAPFLGAFGRPCP